MKKSWSKSFKKHVARNRYVKLHTCVRCNKGGPSALYYCGEPIHLGCLTETEKSVLYRGIVVPEPPRSVKSILEKIEGTGRG